jgi:hypothetical protein
MTIWYYKERMKGIDDTNRKATIVLVASWASAFIHQINT